ncbi:MAG: FecR domain-containing protein [Myxococcales bacterium]|nr:VIT domain-containing protein [Polyangiaceae bacterium]MDW8251355.1 FecR domain-containing protein [Myxococcales bacterium]
MNTRPSPLCQEVAEDIARILEGTAAPELYDHLAECDRCRDLRHEVSQALTLVRSAGADFVAAADLESRICAMLEQRKPPVPLVDASPEKSNPSGEDPTSSGKVLTSQGRLSDEEWATLTQKGEPAKSKESQFSADSPQAPPRPGGEVRSLRPRVALLAASIAAAAAGSALLVRFSSSPLSTSLRSAHSSWSAEVTSLARSDEASDAASHCDPSGRSCAPLSVGDKIPPGSLLRTARHGRLQLRMSDGSLLVLDHNTELLLRDDAPRSARLVRGGLLADIAHLAGAPHVRISLPVGSLEVLGTKFVVRSSTDRSSVQVARGAVLLSADDGSSERVLAGEEGRIAPRQPISVFPSPVISEGFTWSERFTRPDKPRPGDDPSEPLRGLGELRARKPGQQEEKDGAVRLTRHSVQVRIVDGVARTEIDETFHNDTAEELEGIFRFPLPPDAQIERLALEVNGKLEEGAFVEKDRGQAIWRGVIQNAAPKAPKPAEEIVWVPGPWRDPALLEWKRGGRFELRIFPIPARGNRRVVLAYTQTVPAVGGMRRYTYPLPHDGQGRGKLESFQLQAQVRGHDVSQGVKVTGYTVQEKQDGEATKVELSESGFRPSGDLVIEYGMANPKAEVTTWAYQPTSASGDDGSPYVAMALRPTLPRRKGKEAHEQVFVVDTSRSMVGERLRRAKVLVGGIIRELEASDHVQVLACDVGCRPWPQGSVEAGEAAAEAAERFLGGEEADGSSNLAEMVREGRAWGEKHQGGRTLNVVYVGDGGASVGAMKPDHLASEVRRALRGSEGRVTAVALGSDADMGLLEAMTRAGGGVVVPYIPGQKTSEAALSAVGAMNGVVLREAELELPAGFVHVAPSRLETVRAGGEVWVVGRLTSRVVEGEVVLRGKVGGEKWEQKYVVKAEAKEGEGNAFVPRVYAAGRIAELERNGGEGAKKAIEELSKRYAVASRYTSMLVLESEAMMKAFGLNRTSSMPQWSGEQEAVSTTTRGRATASDPTMPEADESPADKAKDAQENVPRSRRDGLMDTDAMAPAQPAARTPTAGPRISSFDDGMPSRRMIPMKKVWDRVGHFFPEVSAWHAREEPKILSAESSLTAKPDSRNLTADLFSLYARHNRVDRASELAERWATRDALDLDALLARADSSARSGDRERSLRRLSSLVDIRSDDITSHTRLADTFDLLGDRERSCAHRISLAELKTDDVKLQTAAVRCARSLGAIDLADRLLADLPQARRDAVFKALEAPLSNTSSLKGDVRLEASWDTDVDLDLALIDPKGRRLSWQGGSKATVTAQEVTSPRGEKVAWSNLGAGSYVLEVTRSKPGATGAVRGTVTVHVVGETRSVPFVLTGQRVEIGWLEVAYQSRLVPAW